MKISRSPSNLFDQRTSGSGLPINYSEEIVRLGGFSVQGVHKTPFSTERIHSRRNQIAMLAQILLQLAFFIVMGFVICSIKLGRE